MTTSDPQRHEETFDDLMPVAKSAMAAATVELQALEEKGYFRFGREALQVLDRIVTGFSPEDVHRLGDNIVAILHAVRSITQPHVLQLVEEASEAIEASQDDEPLGMLGVLKASRDPDVQRGMAVLFAVLREIGRGARVATEKRVSSRAELTARIAPTRMVPVQKKDALAAKSKVAPIEGISFDAEGFLTDPDSWNSDIAEEIARSHGIHLTERHWAVLEVARRSFVESGQSPNVRKLASGVGMSIKEIYTLFPKAPGMTAARIAGIKKPVGCV